MFDTLPWPQVRLGDLCNVVRGGSPRPAGDPRFFGGSFIPWLTVAAITNVSSSKAVITEAVGFLTEAGSRRSRRFQPGTVVIANSGWKCGVAKILGFECCGNDGVAGLENLTGADPRFVSYWINSQTELLRSRSAAGNEQPNLNTDRIAGLMLPFPELEEQEAIAGALSDADGLIEGLERLIAKKRLIKQGAMQDLLTAKRRLPGFSGEWIETTFGQCFQFLRTGSASRSKLGANLGVGYLHYGDIHGMSSPTLDLSKVRLPEISQELVTNLSRAQDGDLVIADASEDILDIGKSVELRGVDGKEVVAGLHTFLLRGNRALVAEGFKAYIQFLHDVRAGIESIATGSSVYGISKKNLQTLKFRVPQTDEQLAIGKVFSDMDAEIQALETRLVKAQQVKEGMMQNLLTGRIRLVLLFEPNHLRAI